jgi:hypothetical protein
MKLEQQLKRIDQKICAGKLMRLNQWRKDGQITERWLELSSNIIPSSKSVQLEIKIEKPRIF